MQRYDIDCDEDQGTIETLLEESFKLGCDLLLVSLVCLAFYQEGDDCFQSSSITSTTSYQEPFQSSM